MVEQNRKEATPIRYETAGEIALITINRPEVLNALSVEALHALSRVLEGFQSDGKMRVAIITGAGSRAFCAGMDLKSTIGRPLDSIFGEGTFVRGLQIRKPLIAAINGYAFGGGLEIALTCDLRIASENALFGLTEVTIGLIPGWGGTQRLTRVLPFGKALEMVLMGRRISAVEALQLNLVNQVVPLLDLLPTAMQWARDIARLDQEQVQTAKQSMMTDAGLAIASRDEFL